MRKKILFILFFLILLIGIALYQNHVPHYLLGLYLSPSDKLSRADAIIVLSGSDDRVMHAIDLYKEGVAPKLVFTGAAKEGPTSNAFAMQIEATKSGVPNEAIILEEKATNTFENATYTREILKQNGYKKIVLVTSPYHQRRAFETFRSVLGDDNVQIINSPSINTSWKVDTWWHSSEDTELTKEEISKVIWALITGSYH